MSFEISTLDSCFAEKQAECAQHRVVFDEIMYLLPRSAYIFIYMLRICVYYFGVAGMKPKEPVVVAKLN